MVRRRCLRHRRERGRERERGRHAHHREVELPRSVMFGASHGRPTLVPTDPGTRTPMPTVTAPRQTTARSRLDCLGLFGCTARRDDVWRRTAVRPLNFYHQRRLIERLMGLNYLHICSVPSPRFVLLPPAVRSSIKQLCFSTRSPIHLQLAADYPFPLQSLRTLIGFLLMLISALNFL